VVGAQNPHSAQACVSNSTLFAKMRVYDGESLKESDPKARSVQEYKDAAGVDDPSPHMVCCSAGTCCGLREPIEGTVVTAAAAPGWISWTALGSGTHTARVLSASITGAGIW
jgi:hypothetical protein